MTRPAEARFHPGDPAASRFMRDWRGWARSARRFGAVLGVAATVFALAPDAAPAQTVRGAIHVNEAVITNFDVEDRVRLLRFFSGRDVPNGRDTAREQLIDDHLKVQEATRQGLEFGEAELATAMENAAGRNNVSVDQLIAQLRRKNVQRSTFEFWLKARELWGELIRRKYGNRLQPSEAEVETALAEEAERAGVKIYDVRQMLLPLSPNAGQTARLDVIARVQSIRDSLSGCGQLNAVAKANGARTGAVGAMKREQMSPQLREIVMRMRPVDVSSPQFTQQGAVLIVLCGISETKGRDREAVEGVLRQQNAERLAQSYLDDLKRAALITQ